MRNKVSIVIPTYNRRALISKCLESILTLSYNNYEIIVIDDASGDSTIELIKSNFKEVVVIRNETRKGPAYGKNQGILKSSGQLVWFLDSDSLIINKDCLSVMVDIMQQNQNIGCLGGELVKEDEQYLVRLHTEKLSEKVLINENSKDTFTMTKVMTLPTCNLITRKDLLSQIGGFDTNFFYISEDSDLCMRIRSLGYDIVLDHRTLVLHQYCRITRKSSFYLLFRNEMRSAIKNQGPLKGFFIEPLRLCRGLIHASKKIPTKALSSSVHNTPIQPAKGPALFMVCGLAFNIILSFIMAYTWNILFLYKTLSIDKKTNYLKQAKI